MYSVRWTLTSVIEMYPHRVTIAIAFRCSLHAVMYGTREPAKTMQSLPSFADLESGFGDEGMVDIREQQIYRAGPPPDIHTAPPAPLTNVYEAPSAASV